MPNYEFTCNSCKNTFNKSTKIDEKHLIKCPKCGSEDLREVFTTNTACNIIDQLKKTGFSFG